MKSLLIIFFAFTLITGCVTSPPAEKMLTDEYIREQIIGSWIVPDVSNDFFPPMAKYREVFHDDGTYTFYAYSDEACTEVDRIETVSYNIEDGVLTSHYNDGTTGHDAVISINEQLLTLRSFESGMTYSRERAETCAR